MSYGKEFRKKEAGRILDLVRRAEEFDGELEVVDAEHRLWRLPSAGARHFDYDPDQQGDFRRIYRPWDFGKRSAVQFWQKVKIGPTPRSYQFRGLGEVTTYNLLVHEVAEEVHRRVETWFGPFGGHRLPFTDYPDVAGRQSNRQTGKTDMKVITDIMRQYESGFTVDAKRIGVKDGIAVGARKMQEILGYEDSQMTRPLMGLVISPLRAPVTLRALSGAGRQNDAGEIDKGKANKELEHVMDVARYVFARQVRADDIVTGPVSVAPVTVDGTRLDPVKDRQAIHANMTRELGRAMKTVVMEQPENGDDWDEF